MLKANFKKYTLDFIRPGGTSRGILHQKDTYFISIYNEKQPAKKGIGEAALFKGLSADDQPDYEQKLSEVCKHIEEYSQTFTESLRSSPSIQFGLETALLSLKNEANTLVFPSKFTKGLQGIRINGLIWMGNKEDMLSQIERKLALGFSCLKLKIGAINFNEELSILQFIRKRYSSQSLEIRVDANGAFKPHEALKKLEILSKLELHSIEQPIKAGQIKKMAELCRKTPLPIALDEELIGIFEKEHKKQLISTIKPQFIILKPALVGGFSGAQEWITTAESLNSNWWITSALESNIGLNAIAQWTYTKNNPLPQGLGTGQVFSNNIDSPLKLKGEQLFFDPNTEILNFSKVTN